MEIQTGRRVLIDQPEKAQKLTVTMTDFKFAPKTVTIRAGVPVELTVVNKGNVEHEFMLYVPPKAAPQRMKTTVRWKREKNPRTAKFHR